MEQETKSSASKLGCAIFAGCGCLALIALVVAAIGGWYFYNQSQTSNLDNMDGWDQFLEDDTATVDSNEQFDVDGTSRGFAIADGFVSDDLYAYQIGAYADVKQMDTDWPALRFTLDYPTGVPPMASANDSGSLWTGVVLDNNYFIQLGMISSDQADADGSMQWNYFWEMWDDHDNYVYGLQVPMSDTGWNTNPANTFTLTCQDPTTGDWEFWVNDEVVGRTNTGDCALQLRNVHLFWELTTTTIDTSQLPTFGPFTLRDLEFWDGFAWAPIKRATLSYSYGRIVDGTSVDQNSVCPPYGAELYTGETAGFRAGSGLNCLPQDTTLWSGAD
ncbi:MAG: hypothetical protein HYV33_04395 [Candidatus Kerfeldbacteria bacterium]|nr:hypothetical protein [Candidatus Kerfeldbacteria bacterium]